MHDCRRSLRKAQRCDSNLKSGEPSRCFFSALATKDASPSFHCFTYPLRRPGSFCRRRSSSSAVQLPERGVKGMQQLVDSTIDGLLHGLRLVAHRERLKPGESGFQ